jgi:hypoxanthine phosphoribosyltransferase
LPVALAESSFHPEMQILPLFSTAEVETRISEIADRLYRDYADSPLTILCIADGAKRFAETLSERLQRGNVRHESCFAVARRSSESDPGAVSVEGLDPTQLEERDVLVVDNITSGGTTLRAVLELLELAETRTVRTAVLVNKRGERQREVRLDYVGFEIESGWVVGYGMDVDGEFRDLDEIGVVGQTAP